MHKRGEGRAAGWERKADSQARGAPEQPGASEDADQYFNDHLAGGPCCFKWAADKLCDVSLQIMYVILFRLYMIYESA